MRVALTLSTTVVLVLCFLAPAYADQTFDRTLYEATHFDLTVTATGGITLRGTGTAEDLHAIVYYVPEAAEDITANPKPASEAPLTFTWPRARAGTYSFAYETLISNDEQKARIEKPVAYPFAVPADVTRYLQPQAITNTNQDIKDLAAQLAHGETDAARVIATTANWVHQNIAYNISTTTVEASETASWTLENRQGVCDELTSLFISLSREQGIPARFVSGLAYTNLETFTDHWGPHGWAEVWLPQYGWIPVDVTYGQVFWTDATHVPFSHAIDAKSNSVEYSMRSNDLEFIPVSIDTTIAVESRSGNVNEPLHVTLEPQYAKVGSQSGNTLTATIRNDAAYAQVVDVTLASTKEITLLDKARQYVFLPAHSERDVAWRVQFPTLEEDYVYTFPFAAIVSRGGNATTAVAGNTRNDVYPVPQEAPQPSGGIPIHCEQPPRLYVGESVSVNCTVSEGVVCASTACDERKTFVAYTPTEAGAFPVSVTARSGTDTGSTVVTFIATPRPHPAISTSVSTITSFEDTPVLTVTVTTETITDATVSVTGKYIDHAWHTEALEHREYALQFPASLLPAGDSDLTITVRGKDKNGKVITVTHTVPVTLPATWWERVQLFVIHLFS